MGDLETALKESVSALERAGMRTAVSPFSRALLLVLAELGLESAAPAPSPARVRVA